MARGMALLLAVTLVLSSQPSIADAVGRDCDRWGWVFTLDLPPGFWAEGSHVYEIRSSPLTPGPDVVFTVPFEVDAAAPLIRGEVLLLLFGPAGHTGRTFTLNPAQDTAFFVGWISGGTMASVSRAEAEARADATRAAFSWDDRAEWTAVEHSVVSSRCAIGNEGRFMRDWSPDFEAQ